MTWLLVIRFHLSVSPPKHARRPGKPGRIPVKRPELRNLRVAIITGSMDKITEQEFIARYGFDPFKCHDERNWPEDYEHENGNYINTCGTCKLAFKGHKRRVRCRMCSEPDWMNLAAIQRPEHLPVAYSGCWLEGEMVGFSRCMVQVVKPLQAEIARLNALIESAAFGD